MALIQSLKALIEQILISPHQEVILPGLSLVSNCNSSLSLQLVDLTPTDFGLTKEEVHAQLCLTLCNSMAYSSPGSSVHGILQARILERVSISSPGDLPYTGIEPASLHLLNWQVNSLTY